MAHLLLERSTRQQGTPRVDLEAGIIYDAKFLGNESENGRNYGLKCRRDALPLYEGASINQNHPENERKLDRRVQDWVGVLRNVRAEADGNYGDLHLLKEHRDYKVLMEAASKFWQNFGLSHVAFGDGKKRNGVENVTSIEEVRSVDIVLDPATCSNLFESKGKRMAATATTKPKRRLRTLTQIIESTGDATGDALKFRKLLKESTEGDAPAVPAETQAAVPEGASTENTIKAGLIQAAVVKLSEIDGATFEKVCKLLGLGTKVGEVFDGGKPAEPAPAPDSGEETPMAESKVVAELSARLLLLEAGHKAADISDVMVESLANTAKEKRRELLKSWKLEAAPAAPRKGKPKESPPAFLEDDADDEGEDDFAMIESRFKDAADANKAFFESRRR